MKIVVLDGYANNPGDLNWDDFKELGDVTIYDRSSQEEVKERIKDADVVLSNKARIGKDELENSKVKYIGVIATGFDVIDLEYCKKNNITVTNVPNYSTNAVVQMTFSHILNYFNRVDEYADKIRNGRWKDSKDFCFYLNTIKDISNLTLGIIGYGTIGKKVGEIAKAFGMKLIVLNHGEKKEDYYLDADEFYKKADIISLHAPLNDSTFEMINKDSINKMKDGVIIVNTARGKLVNEKDLAYALDKKKVKAYLSDVLYKEPMEKDHIFLGREDVFLTPHIAWASYDSRVELMRILFENLKKYIDGKPQNVVSK